MAEDTRPLPERLRTFGGDESQYPCAITVEAAEEIERLQAVVEQFRPTAYRYFMARYVSLVAGLDDINSHQDMPVELIGVVSVSEYFTVLLCRRPVREGS